MQNTIFSNLLLEILKCTADNYYESSIQIDYVQINVAIKMQTK